MKNQLLWEQLRAPELKKLAEKNAVRMILGTTTRSFSASASGSPLRAANGRNCFALS